MTDETIQIDNRPAEEKQYRFKFHGQASEYFRIWIVNIALTLLTLGIYSAWAKVRTYRYFYGSTSVDGSCFEYLASPIIILKGRLIAVALFALYWFISHFIPLLIVPVFVLFLIAIPWIVSRSLVFRAHNTAWRNVRFGFKGNYWDVAKVFIFWPMLIPFTLGLIWPFVHHKQKQLLVANSEFGKSVFKFSATVKDFYQVYAIAFIMMLLLPMLVALLISISSGLSDLKQGQPPTTEMILLSSLIMFISMTMYYLVYVFLNTKLLNLIFNHSSIGAGRLESTLSVRRLMWIYFTNGLAIALSVGLLLPWAKIRLARYRAKKTCLYSAEGLHRYQSMKGRGINALGEETGELFDVDLSL